MWPYIRIQDDHEGEALNWIFENLEHVIDAARGHYGHKDFLIVNLIDMEWHISTGYTASKIDELSLDDLKALHLITDCAARRVYAESILNDTSNLSDV